MIEMKNSGVDWLGEIPEHWEVKRLKDVSILYSGLTGKAGEDFSPEPEDGLKPYIPFTNVLNNREIDPNTVNYVRIDKGEEQNLVNKDDLIFLMSSEDYDSIAKSAVVTSDVGEVYLNSFCRGLHITKKTILPKFLNYLLLASSCRDALRFEARGFTRINIKIDKIASHFIFYPPFKEQQAIADYLDKKTAEIDEQITALEKKSDAYQRLKRSLISEVVTRGLNPTAELKDSGIEWIGEIPEHWEIDRVKSFAKTIKGKSCDYLSDPTTDCYQVLSVESLRQDECQFYDYVKVDDDSQICSPDDMVVIWDGAGVGEFLRAKNGALSSTIAKVKFTSKKVLPKYFWYWRYKIEYRLKSIPTGMGIPHLNPNLLNNYKIAIPPLVEQQAIADYLDKKTAEIDSNISAISSKIDAYKRLKQSLIDEVVTGKRRIEKA